MSVSIFLELIYDRLVSGPGRVLRLLLAYYYDNRPYESFSLRKDLVCLLLVRIKFDIYNSHFFCSSHLQSFVVVSLLHLNLKGIDNKKLQPIQRT